MGKSSRLPVAGRVFAVLLLAPALASAAPNSPHAAQRTDPAATVSPDMEARCRALLSARLTDARIVTARMMPARANGKIPVPAHCRVEGRIEGNIGFALWLPAPAFWNGRMLGAGVGGSAGRYNLVDLERGLTEGFAGVTTDSGHKESEPDWMLDAKKVEDYAHRATHLSTVTGKALIEEFYGTPVANAYFIGCSGGGRQALKEAQQYPDDYQGIIAGAPGINVPVSSSRLLWVYLLEQRSPQVKLTADDWQLVFREYIRQCDELDGLGDGIVDDPRQCAFKPAKLACPPQRHGDRCLSPARLRMIARIAAPIDDENGDRTDPGLLPGVRTRPGAMPSLAVGMIRDVVYGGVGWEPEDFVMARDTPAVAEKLKSMFAIDPDLSRFRAQGGKLLIYQGWQDPSVRAQATVGYYERVVAAAGGASQTARFARLFMVPGMEHCGGGYAFDKFGGSYSTAIARDADHDVLKAMMRWVEQGIAPQRIVAGRLESNAPPKTRPLCPYPQSARYQGAGDVDDARNFHCEAPGASGSAASAPTH